LTSGHRVVRKQSATGNRALVARRASSMDVLGRMFAVSIKYQGGTAENREAKRFYKALSHSMARPREARKTGRRNSTALMSI